MDAGFGLWPPRNDGARMTLVIFDCDGVLIDSEVIACRVDAEVLTGLGFPYSARDIMERFVGKSFADMVRSIEAEHGVALPADFPATIDAALADGFARHLKAVDGIEAVIEGLAHRRCVASSSTHARLALTLGLTRLDRFFPSAIFSAEDVARGKPAPDLFLHAARTMGAEPAACIVIEDSPAGIEAALSAGMAAIGFCAGGHCAPGHAERLRAAGAQAIVAAAAELPAAIAAALAKS